MGKPCVSPEDRFIRAASWQAGFSRDLRLAVPLSTYTKQEAKGRVSPSAIQDSDAQLRLDARIPVSMSLTSRGMPAAIPQIVPVG